MNEVKVSKPIAAEGECRCHGVKVSGPLALKAKPKQPYYETDFWTGKRVASWFIDSDTGAHDIPVKDATVTYEEVKP